MTAINPGRALALVLTDELARAGLRDACIAPGSRSAPLAMAMADDKRIRTHVVIDERSAAFMALGIAKASGSPVAVLTTSGTAAANLHPAVIESDQSRTPLLVLTADRPPELRDSGANQTIDQLKLYGNSVRWFCDVGVPEPRAGSVRYWRALGARAWAETQGSPPGPVHLNLAFREPLVPVEDEAGFPWPLDGRGAGPWTVFQPHAGLPADADVEWLADVVSRTERGLVVAGAGAVDVGPILELARAASWPVLAEPSSGLRAGECAVSTYDALLRVEAFARAHRPDFVIRVGKLGISRALDALLGVEVPQALFDRDGAWLDHERVVERIVTCDPGLLCGQVAKAATARNGSHWLASWLDAELRARQTIDELLDSQEAPSEPRTARDLGATLKGGEVLVVAASMPVRDLDWFMAPRTGLKILANRGTNGIDGFVSTAVGVALGSGAPTYALAGDLALIHDQNGLLSARVGGVDLTIVVLNNGGGGIFSFLPPARFPEHFERLFKTPHGLDLGTLAKLYGCHHALVSHATDLVAQIDTARSRRGVSIVEVVTDAEANVDLHKAIWRRVALALG